MYCIFFRDCIEKEVVQEVLLELRRKDSLPDQEGVLSVEKADATSDGDGNVCFEGDVTKCRTMRDVSQVDGNDTVDSSRGSETATASDCGGEWCFAYIVIFSS